MRRRRSQKKSIGNLRTTTTTWSTTTGSELQCTAQARPVNFVVVVSSTTPNKVASRRPAIHRLRQAQIHCFKQFLKPFAFSYPRKSRYRSFFFPLQAMLIENSTNELIFTSKNDNSCGGRASELVSEKFICTYLGKANHISLI